VTSGGKEADWIVAAFALAGEGYALLRSHFAKWFAATTIITITTTTTTILTLQMSV
jgi:hypothetical protein